MIAMEMRRYNISVLGIAETRWTQTGQFRLATGKLILYSGHTHDGAPHTKRSGIHAIQAGTESPGKLGTNKLQTSYNHI